MDDPNAEKVLPLVELKAIKFDLMSSTDMEKLSSATIIEASDVTSARLGLPNGAPQCETCGAHSVRECDGHFGVIKLATTVFNPYNIRKVVQLLNHICPGCHSPKQNRVSQRSDGATSRATCKYCAKDDTEQYPDVIFKILTSPRITLSKSKYAKNPNVRDTISVTAEVADRVTVLPQDYWDFVPHHHPPQSNMTKTIMSPYQVYYILEQVDRELVDQFVPRRELIFLSCLPVTPNCHRVAELPYGFADGPRLVYDDLTKAYKRTVDAGRKIDDLRQHTQFSVLASALVTSRVMECLKLSKLYSKKTDKESSTDTHGMKWLKDAILSKRSDNAFRSTMVGDPKIRLHEIGIPMDLASTLTVSEHVNSYNFDNINSKCNVHLLSKEVLVIQRSKKTILVREENQLVIGDIVQRLLQDGDLILINRPPSVHQHSLIALSAKLLPVKSVVSINPLCCAPFAGDFDGDCLHGYVPQSIQSRVELGQLVSLSQQLLNVQDGRSLVSLTHDSLAAAYLVTSSEILLKKTEVQQFQMLCHPFSPTPAPAVVKSIHSNGPLWTGKQLFGMLLPSNMSFSIDSKVHIIDGEVLACSSESWLQNSISGLYTLLCKQYGDKALEFLSSAQDVLCEFLTMRGLSVCLSDIYLFTDHDLRRKLADEVNLALDDAEEAFRIKQLLLSPDSIPILKCYDDCADVSKSYEQSDSIQSNLPLIKSSITAFKSVFSDLLKMVQQHTAKDNSMMVMVNSGSKGSMLKFVQQTACVGLQLPASRFPFRIPSELSCASWNRHKSEGTGECLGGQKLHAVIRNSFAGGLNPLECLLHSISGRANFFSENADVPGTLTRKLMYHLRDVYVAYDGTVRSSYGQQIMQFTYDTAEDMCSDRNLEGELGAPVGSWAACSISEAAYGALDHPVNSLEDSPLMNLQDVLKCQKGANSLDHFGLLFLSKNLKKYRYGLEYASLEVKAHLEPVNFSDLVDTVMILYGGCGIQSTKENPWITHFHLSQEMLTRKRLGLRLVVEELTEQYNARRDELNNVIPKVYISKGKCSVDNECGNRQNCCITVVTQDESDSMSQLDTIKKRVIPNLLSILVKGFLEFKDIEIQCQEDSELVVKVVMSKHCKSGMFWTTLQESCIAIMELIDWERSRPGSVYDIFCSYGIDSAWKYFVESLRSKTDDIGKNIRREHLLVAANCLSVSGQFHGLSSQGLKQQRTQLTISSPFSEACFSRPAHSFINAAKQSSVDNLCGTVDAMAWGKEPSTGTSGPFKIMYSGKAHAPVPNENIYDFLHSPEVQQVPRDSVLNGSTISAEQDFLGVTVGIWDNIIDMRTCLQNMLREYQLNECVVELDKSHVIEALRFHPRGHEKIGAGIKDIKIGHHPRHPGTRCFVLVRSDDTTEDFSYKKCVQGAADSISPELGRYMERILRNRAIPSQ